MALVAIDAKAELRADRAVFREQGQICVCGGAGQQFYVALILEPPECAEDIARELPREGIAHSAIPIMIPASEVMQMRVSGVFGAGKG